MMYAFGVELRLPFSQALDAVNEAIREAGLGVVSEIDVQAVMRKKLNEEVPAYRILGACAPGLAKRVMEADPEAGALLPCNIIVREIAHDVAGVTFMDPEAVFALSDVAAVQEVGREAKKLIESVRDRLAGQHQIDLTE